MICLCTGCAEHSAACTRMAGPYGYCRRCFTRGTKADPPPPVIPGQLDLLDTLE